ncbi:MAG: hypothetical protein WCA00_15940 [Candidatus Acidiferrales bacterium]
MNNRFKITLYDQPIVSGPGGPSRPGPISRFKLTLFGILAAVLAFGALAVALLVGWVIAAVFGAILILATLGVFLKAALRRR